MRITDHWKDILIDRNRSSRCLRKLQLITSSPTRKFLNQSRYDNFQNWLEV